VAIAGVIAILVATLQPASGEPMNAHLCVVCGPLGGVDSILNVLLFVPFGVGLSLSRTPFRRTILTAFAISLLVETTQFFFIPGRDATLGDLLTNTLGAALGFAILRSSRRWLLPSQKRVAFLALAWAVFWLTIQLVSAFGLAPSISGTTFYGEIAPELGNFDRFRGRVIDANVGGVTIRDALLTDVDLAGHRFSPKDLVSVTVVPANPTTGIAPILRLADVEQREMLLVAQHEHEMLFAFETGAVALRLRPPLFGLRGVFPEAPTAAERAVADTLTLRAHHAARRVTMSAGTTTGLRENDIRITASLGWTLVLPAQWFIEGTIAERILSSIWVAFLVLPLGYWAGRARRGTAHGTSGYLEPSLWIATGACLVVGLALVPPSLRLAPTPVYEWLAAIAGLLLGAACEGLFRHPIQSTSAAHT